jgi:hypothetical protein
MANSSLSIFSAAALLATGTGTANAAAIIARTPTISGNGWVALAIIGGFVAIVIMTIRGALHVERRDAALGRRHDRGDHGWFGVAPRRDDEDGPDFSDGNNN